MHRRSRGALVAVQTLTAPPARIDATRRRVLGSFIGAYVASRVPWAVAAPVDDGALAPFRALSVILVGRDGLDPALGKRLHDALVADNAEFDRQAQALLELIERRRIEPLHLQRTLDAEHPEFATLPRAIVMAWYLGIVGDPAHARCIAYENALGAVVVADRLKPPSYCYGAYGSWARAPG